MESIAEMIGADPSTMSMEDLERVLRQIRAEKTARKFPSVLTIERTTEETDTGRTSDKVSLGLPGTKTRKLSIDFARALVRQLKAENGAAELVKGIESALISE